MKQETQLSNKGQTLIVRDLGLQAYMPIWHRMQEFTNTRTNETPDEIWVTEHESVFTQGQAGKQEHVLAPGDIPVVPVDRGGQVTYHGPGQLMMYILINIRRKKIGVRDLVSALESCIVRTLELDGINAYPKADAPGVYVDEKKVCSVGLRIRKGCSFHGLAFNVDMDLSPFSRINPCGYAGLEMTDSAKLGGNASMQKAKKAVVANFCQILNIDLIEYKEGFDE